MPTPRRSSRRRGPGRARCAASRPRGRTARAPTATARPSRRATRPRASRLGRLAQHVRAGGDQDERQQHRAVADQTRGTSRSMTRPIGPAAWNQTAMALISPKARTPSAGAVAAVLGLELAGGGGVAAGGAGHRRRARGRCARQSAATAWPMADERRGRGTGCRAAALAAPGRPRPRATCPARGGRATSSGCSCHRPTLTLNSTVTREAGAGVGPVTAAQRPAAARSCAQVADLVLGRVDQRQPHRADVESAQPQPGLDQDRALGAEDAGVDRQQLLVQPQWPRRRRRARTPRSSPWCRGRRSAWTCRPRRPRRRPAAAASSRRRRCSRPGRSRR